MPKYEAELSDGSVVEVESDQEPTSDQILAAAQAYSQERAQKKEALAQDMAQVRRERVVGDTMEKAIDVAQYSADRLSKLPSEILNQPARIREAVTGELTNDPFQPGRAAIAEIPEPQGDSALAGLGKFGARVGNMLQSPEALVTLPIVPTSPALRGIFGTEIIRHIPESVKESAKVFGDIGSTPADKVLATLTPPSQAFMAGLVLKSGVKPEPPTQGSALRMPAGAKPATAETPAPTPGEMIQGAVERDPLAAVSEAPVPEQWEPAITESTAAPTSTLPPKGITKTSTGESFFDYSGPGAASPAEFAQRLREPPKPPNEPVAVDASVKPDVEVVQRNKDYHLFNRINSGQWAFDFGRLGEAAKSAWERMAIGEFRMRESIKRDTQSYVRDTLSSVPRPMRKEGGKAFFDVLDGKRMEDVTAEWQGKPGGDKVIAAAERLKTRMEEIRSTIRDTKRDSYHAYLSSLDREGLETMFRNSISDKVDTARMTKEQFADGLSMAEFPDDWGIADGSYLPHLFFGNWKVEAKLAGEQTPSFVTRAKTAAEAKAKIHELSRNNPEYANAKWTVGQDTVIPADMIRLGDRNFWKLISKMKEQVSEEVNVKDAIQGIVGRKASKQKWFGSLQKREGFTNYSKDFDQVMSAYLNGFHRWKELSEMQRDVQPKIDAVKAEGRLNAAKRLDELMDNLWGKPAASTVEFDAFVRQIPGLRNYIKPLALDRWSRNVRSMVSLLTLSTLRFAVINRLQPLQGLYPIVGERLLVKGKALQHSAEGKALLDEAGVTMDPGQYADTRAGLSRAKDAMERLRGERTNQEWAFLSMYLHGTEQGMAKPAAIKYAKLRGQLMTQFTPLVVDTPQILQGPVTGSLFQFKRFPIKQTELIANMVSNGQIGGIARMLAVFGLVGGASVYMRQAWLDKKKRLALRNMLKSELGEKGADALIYGLPGLLNADLSGSLVLADEPMGSDPYAQAARTVAGPAVSIGVDTARAAMTEEREPMSGKDKAVSILRRFPSLRPIAELMSINDDEMLAPDGETKYRRKVADAIVSIGSFRSAHESNQRTAIDAIVELKKEEMSLKNAYYVAKAGGGDVAKALADIDAFNKRWPEVRIQRQDLREYLEYRRTNSRKTDMQRMAGKKYRRLIEP